MENNVSGRAVKGMGLLPLACGFADSNPAGVMESVSLSCVLSGIRLFDGPIPRPDEPCRVCECVCLCVCVSVNVIRYNNNPLHQQRVGKRDQIKKERKKERKKKE